jgi:hypothetical protein
MRQQSSSHWGLFASVEGKSFLVLAGPFNLGWYTYINGTIACLWVAFITVLFVLPTTYPVTSNNLNYAGIAVGIVLVFSFGW